jgi:hypothetical protein
MTIAAKIVAANLTSRAATLSATQVSGLIPPPSNLSHDSQLQVVTAF